MRFLPIVERELRTMARRRGTYWFRVLFAFSGVMLGAFVYLVNLQSSSSEFASIFIGVLSGLAVVYSLFAGLIFTSDCLSEERREGTLGLLFLTDLKGYDVILGKMAATSLRGFYALVALFPVLAIPLMSGGVTYMEFWRLVLAVTNIFAFSLAAGMFVSAISRVARKAMLGAMLLILLFATLPMVIAAVIQIIARGRAPHAAWIAMTFSPCSTLVWIGDGSYRPYWKLFWSSVGICWGWSGLALALASWITPRSWQDRPAGRRSLRWRAVWRRFFYGDAEAQRAFRHRLLGVNAFYWLASRVRPKPAGLWVMLVCAAVLWGWGCLKTRGDWFNEGVYFPTMIILNLVLKVYLAAEAGREFGEGRESRTLEVVLSTPLGGKDILRGQWLALRRQFRTPFTIVIGVQLIFLAGSLERESLRENTINPVLWLASLVMLLADAAALVWLATWLALLARKPRMSTGNAIVAILFLPVGAFVVIVTAVSAINQICALELPAPHWKALAGLWFGLGLATDLLFGFLAWWNVRTRFRQLALRPTGAGAGPFSFMRRRYSRPGT
jgi:ABC-type transport system involved in cytochrome c biogenesis permease component